MSPDLAADCLAALCFAFRCASNTAGKDVGGPASVPESSDFGDFRRANTQGGVQISLTLRDALQPAAFAHDSVSVAEQHTFFRPYGRKLSSGRGNGQIIAVTDSMTCRQSARRWAARSCQIRHGIARNCGAQRCYSKRENALFWNILRVPEGEQEWQTHAGKASQGSGKSESNSKSAARHPATIQKCKGQKGDSADEYRPNESNHNPQGLGKGKPKDPSRSCAAKIGGKTIQSRPRVFIS